MGALFNGKCYDTAGDATHAAYSSVPPAIAPGAITTVEYTGTGWQIVTRSDAGTTSASLPVLSFAECEPLDSVVDGIALGWLVAVVWLVAFAFVAYRRALV